MECAFGFPLRPASAVGKVFFGVLLQLAALQVYIVWATLTPYAGWLRRAVVYAVGLLCTAFAHTPLKLVLSTLLTSVGCICIPALVAFIANQAEPAERGALLGALETLQELTDAFAHSSYGRIFGASITETARVKLPGAVFLAASTYMLGGLAVVQRTFGLFAAEAAKFF